jgi:hypothetical protein
MRPENPLPIFNLWQHSSVAGTATLTDRLREAAKDVVTPAGVTWPPTIAFGDDGAEDFAAWLIFKIDDRIAHAADLRKFVRNVRTATAEVDPTLTTYVRFAPKAPKRQRPKSTSK